MDTVLVMVLAEGRRWTRVPVVAMAGAAAVS